MKRPGSIGNNIAIVLIFCLVFMLPVTAYTTEVTVRRYSIDGLTPITETTVDYQWMEAHLPVYGDGDTTYYFQGPIFEAEWEANYGVSFPEYRADWEGSAPAWLDSEEVWDRYWNGTGYDQMEDVNWQTKNLGKLKGTNVRDLCDLAGGLPPGKTARVLAADNAFMDVPYSVIYTPTDQLGPYVISWWSVDAGESGATSGYSGPDYTNGMRATFLADDSRNQNSEHVAGLGDQAEGIPEAYWYYYSGDSPSMGGWTVKYVNRIYVYSNDPVPSPEADFLANTKTGRVQNGNFESSTTLSPWSATGGATRHTGSATYRHGNASAKLSATVGNPASIQQDVDLSDIGAIYFWRYTFGGSGKYLQVIVDDTVIANFTETTTVANKYESVDISSFGFTGTHTLKIKATSGISGTFTVYLDDIEDYGPGTSGPAPLSIQFTDLSTKMEDPAHTFWAWDFNNDGTTDSTARNPLFTFTAEGTYTVKLTATNAGGSDSETKTGHIIVGQIDPPVADFTAVPTAGTAPLVVAFTDTSTNGPVTWAWDFGDGGTSADQTPSHEYATAGTYTVTLTATNAAGSDTDIKEDYITVTGPVSPPVARFSAAPLSGSVPFTVSFTDESTNTPTAWSWDFGDGGTSTDQNPSHEYTAAGDYTVTLTATNDGGSDEESKAGYITATAPYIDISISGSINAWNFQAGTNENTDSVDMTVDTNMPEWAVSVCDALNNGKPAGTEGRMAEWSVSGGYVTAGEYLTHALKVKSGTRDYLTLTGTSQPLQGGTTQGIVPFDIGIQQEISATDPALGAGHQYHIVITFTGAAA